MKCRDDINVTKSEIYKGARVFKYNIPPRKFSKTDCLKFLQNHEPLHHEFWKKYMHIIITFFELPNL